MKYFINNLNNYVTCATETNWKIMNFIVRFENLDAFIIKYKIIGFLSWQCMRECVNNIHIMNLLISVYKSFISRRLWNIISYQNS